MARSFFARVALCSAVALLGLSQARATVYNMDLTSGAGNPTTVNGAIFQITRINSGSGTYTRMFGVDEQQKDSQNTLPSGSAQAYNDSVKNNLPFNQKTGNGFNPTLTMGQLPVVTINGTQYLQIVADYNGSSLTIADLRVYASNTAGTNVSTVATLPNLGTLVYDFNAGGGNSINVTGIPSGSGYSDMSYNIPLSYFSAFTSTASIYVFVRFDNQVGGGYQEIAYDPNGVQLQTVLPEARTVWGGLFMGLILVGQFVRGRFQATL